VTRGGRKQTKTWVKGKKPSELDIEQLQALASIHCTMEEIALVMGVSRDHLYRRYKDVIDVGYAQGKRSLRRRMWEAVEKGNVQMMIHMAKHILGHREDAAEKEDASKWNIIVHEIPKQIEIKAEVRGGQEDAQGDGKDEGGSQAN